MAGGRAAVSSDGGPKDPSLIKVSVIMPAHNVESTLDEAVQSVLAQKGLSFELLIGDDASTDHTWQRIQAYRKDPRVRAWRLGTHRGVSAAGNFLADRARGQYLSSCDADDAMLPGHLAALSRVLDRMAGVGVVYGDLLVWEAPHRYRPFRRNRGPAHTWDLLGCSIANIGTLIRRSLFKEVGGYRPDLTLEEDCELFFRLAEVTQLHHLSGEPLYLYRKRRGSLSDQPQKRYREASQGILREVILRRYGFRVPW